MVIHKLIAIAIITLIIFLSLIHSELSSKKPSLVLSSVYYTTEKSPPESLNNSENRELHKKISLELLEAAKVQVSNIDPDSHSDSTIKNESHKELTKNTNAAHKSSDDLLKPYGNKSKTLGETKVAANELVRGTPLESPLSTSNSSWIIDRDKLKRSVRRNRIDRNSVNIKRLDGEVVLDASVYKLNRYDG